MSTPTPISNALIKETATDAMVFRGTAGCLEDIKTAGYYIVDASSTTTSVFPYSNQLGVLEVFPRAGGALQRFTPMDSTCICQRFYSANAKSWTMWYKVTLTKVTA